MQLRKSITIQISRAWTRPIFSCTTRGTRASRKKFSLVIIPVQNWKWILNHAPEISLMAKRLVGKIFAWLVSRVIAAYIRVSMPKLSRDRTRAQKNLWRWSQTEAKRCSRYSTQPGSKTRSRSTTKQVSTPRESQRQWTRSCRICQHPQRYLWMPLT